MGDLSIKIGNFLYRNAFPIYKPVYFRFKNKQDAFEIALLKKHIHQNAVVLDIGANIGFYAKLLSDLSGPGGQVHCFEPDVQNFKHLQKTCAGLKNVILHNKAVGPRTENLKIYTSKLLNVDHRTYKPEEYDEVKEIAAVSIDDMLHDHKADFIKMDIQGFEMQAIQGMQQVLAKNKNLKIISEFWPYGLKKAGSSLWEYFNFLKQNGFSIYLLEENALIELSETKVKEMENLGQEFYFNIYAERNHV